MIHASSKYDHIQDHAGVIPAYEPVFLLRATDPLTPHAVRAWMDAARKAGVPPGRIHSVEKHLTSILNYQVAHRDKLHLPGTPYINE